MSKPNEKPPRNSILDNYWPPPGHRHYVQTGERWESVAAHFRVDVKALIYHNFKTTQKEEINWYLRTLVGCKVSTDGENWAFSSGLSPGYIVIPAGKVDMEPYEYTVPESEIKRLKPIAKTIPGLPGERIRCLLAMAEKYGPDREDGWWYYSSQPTMIYTKWQTTNQQRRWMTQPTQGRLPFDGHAGAAYGYWKTYPFRRLKIDCINGCSDADLKHKIKLIEEDFRKSLYYVDRVDRSGGGSHYGPLVEEFVKHVHALSKSPIHLYSCGGLGPAEFRWWGD